MGGEFRRKGVNIALGPGQLSLNSSIKLCLTRSVIGPLGRVSLGGRNWEGKKQRTELSLPCVDEPLLTSRRVFKRSLPLRFSRFRDGTRYTS
jgi:hypothetical protein